MSGVINSSENEASLNAKNLYLTTPNTGEQLINMSAPPSALFCQEEDRFCSVAGETAQSESDQPRSSGVFFTESWPAVNDRQSDELPLPAPHVIACAHAAVVLHLSRTDVDMIVWGRQVPKSWSPAFQFSPHPDLNREFTGSPTDIVHYILSEDISRNYHKILRDDVAELSSLLGAMTAGLPQRLRISCVTNGQTESENSGSDQGQLRLVCGYGTHDVEWCSNPDDKSTFTSTLGPYSVAFIKGGTPMEGSVTHRLIDSGSPRCKSGLHITIDAINP